MPKFADPLAWQQAELLMQPVFIRLVDNLRKQLDQCTWQSSYQTIETWPDGTAKTDKQKVAQLQQQLAKAAPEQAPALEQELSQLPQPQVVYQLHLQHQGQQVTLDLWELCYQICFTDYDTERDRQGHQTVTIDMQLINETGEVDWHCLDNKAQTVVQQAFAQLPFPQA